MLDVVNNCASIPGSRDVSVVFTHTRDTAKFVIAILDLDEWDPETFVVGDKITFNGALRLAEGAKGAKFKVVYDDDIEKMRSGQTAELPGQTPMYSFLPEDILHYMVAVHGVWFEEGVYNLKPGKFLNEMFPQIKSLRVAELFEKA